jgi:hypothetical protein
VLIVNRYYWNTFLDRDLKEWFGEFRLKLHHAMTCNARRAGINTGFTWHVMNILYTREKETYNLMGVPLDGQTPSEYVKPF